MTKHNLHFNLPKSQWYNNRNQIITVFIVDKPIKTIFPLRPMKIFHTGCHVRPGGNFVSKTQTLQQTNVMLRFFTRKTSGVLFRNHMPQEKNYGNSHYICVSASYYEARNCWWNGHAILYTRLCAAFCVMLWVVQVKWEFRSRFVDFI